MRIEEAIGAELTWNQPSMWKSRYVLAADAEPIAELEYQGAWQTSARVSGDDGCFDLTGRGFWRSAYEIMPCGNNQSLAVYRRNVWKSTGTLEFPFGRQYITRANNWRSEIHLTLPENDQVLILCARTSMWKVGGKITLQPGATFLQPLGLVVLVCWFAHVQQYRDQMAAAAA